MFFFLQQQNIFKEKLTSGFFVCLLSCRCFFCPIKRDKQQRELWKALFANFKKTVDNEPSLLPKTQSSACENIAATKLELSDDK